MNIIGIITNRQLNGIVRVVAFRIFNSTIYYNNSYVLDM